MKKRIRESIGKLRSGCISMQKPLSLLIFVWLIGLLMMGFFTKYFGKNSEYYKAIIIEEDVVSEECGEEDNMNRLETE